MAELKRVAREELQGFAKSRYMTDFATSSPKKQSILATKYYIQEIYNRTRAPIPDDEELDGSIVDGPNDLGIDLIYRDNNHVVIVQTKYHKKGTAESKESIQDFLSILQKLRNPDLTPNKYLQDAAGEIDWSADTFELIFITFGDIKNQARAVSNQSPQYPADPSDLPDRCTWHFIDNEQINLELRNADLIASGAVSHKTMKLHPVGPKGKRGLDSVLDVTAGSYKSYVMALDAKQMVEAYRQLGRDGIFSLNIRNYIGNTPINKKISETAERDVDDFFLCNNGISCLATKVTVEEDHVSVTGLQVINGAQTVRTLVKLDYDANRSGKALWVPSAPQLLVRITEIPEGYASGGRIREKIIRANNTQNSIRDSDFRSNDNVQVQLIKQFAELIRKGKQACYLPKRTDRPLQGREHVKLEDFSKSVYAFLYDPTDFSGNSAMLYDDSKVDYGYRRVFGDGKNVWLRMPDNEFRYRAAIHWIAEEIASHLKKYRNTLGSPDQKAALERKWLVVYAAKVVIEQGLASGETLMSEVSKFCEGDWRIDGADKRSQRISAVFLRAAKAVVFAYQQDKKTNAKFVHRNWMRGTNTTQQISDAVKALTAYSS